MSTSNETMAAGWDIEIPAGWTVIDAPEGVALIAVDDDEEAVFRSNLVVTHQPRQHAPADEVSVEEPSVDAVNRYVDALLDALEANLPDPTILGVWTAGRDAHRLATQRVLIAYRAPVGDGGVAVEVEMLQQHIWLADDIVTVTVTVPADVHQPMIDVLNTCVESIR